MSSIKSCPGCTSLSTSIQLLDTDKLDVTSGNAGYLHVHTIQKPLITASGTSRVEGSPYNCPPNLNFSLVFFFVSFCNINMLLVPRLFSRFLIIVWVRKRAQLVHAAIDFVQSGWS